MSGTVIQVENLSKQYRLGNVGLGSMSHDINRWWQTTVKRKEDPYLKIGEVNDRATKGQSEYVWALRNINFEVKQGEVLGIIGRNGAGKSTLLKILSRTTSPTTGSIKIKGRVASLLEVGTGFHPELTGRENVFLNGAILGMTKQEIKSKFDEIVDFAGVERYIDTPVKRYSSGMYVRLAFGVAAHLEPEILIVDEVLAVGDIEFQKKALGKMKDVSSKQGRTVLFVSHNMAAISTLCNTLLLLKNGTINYYGEIKAGIDVYEESCFSENKMENLLSKINLIDDDFFELIGFEISQNNNNSVDFSLSKEIFVILNYRVKRKVLGLRIGVDLIEKKTQIIIFRTFHDDRYEKIEFTETGNYTSRLTLPKNFLNSGSYTLSISIGVHNVKWIIHDTLKVDLTINNTDVFNKYSDIRPGLIMPKLNWETK